MENLEETFMRAGLYAQIHELPSSPALCARDMLEGKAIERQYGVRIPGNELVEVGIVSSDRDTRFTSRDDALSFVAEWSAGNTVPGRIEGVNVFVLPEMDFDKSGGYGKEVVKESPKHWMLYIHHPPTVIEV